MPKYAMAGLIIGTVVLAIVELLVFFAAVYTTGQFIFRKLSLFRLTHRDSFKDASDEEYWLWRKLERISLIFFFVVWVPFVIFATIKIVHSVLAVISLCKGDIIASELFMFWGFDVRMHWGPALMIFVFVLVLMADLYERAAKRFGDKVGIDWPGKLEEAYNLDPLPEEFRQKVLRRRYPIFAPKIEEVERHKMPDNWKTYLLAIDPGRDKCGIALLTDAGEIAAKSICKRDRFEDVVKELMGEYKPSRVAVGDGTGSSEIIKILEGMVGEKVAVVKEKGTTLEARELAWREQPPKGYRWLPKIFWPDPADLDAWAAVVIGRRFLERDRP